VIVIPTITCEFERRNYVVGQAVKAPIILCDDGSDFSDVTFSPVGIAVENSDNWKIPNGSTKFTSEGQSIYGVVGTCGDVRVEAVACNTLTITGAPTPECKLNEHSFEVGQIVNLNPEVTCSGDAEANGGTLTYVSGAGDLSGGNKYTTEGTRKYKVSGVVCGEGEPADATCTPDITVSKPAITCGWATKTYKGGESVPAPVVKCVSSNSPATITSATFTTSGTAVEDIAKWKAGQSTAYPLATTQYTSTYKISGAVCDGYEAAEATCDALTITPSPTATCTFATPPSPYKVGDEVTAPTVGCSAGTTKTDITGRAFSTSGTALVAQADLADKWAKGNAAASIAKGTSTYKVSGVICDDIPVAEKECTPALTIAAPAVTCAFAKNSYKVGEKVLAPTVTCDKDGSAAAGTKTFSKVNGNDATNYTNWATGGNATYSATGSSQYKVSGATCGGIAADDANCTALTITAAPTATCSFSKASYNIGETVPAPTFTCAGSNTSGDITNANFAPVTGSGKVSAKVPANWKTSGGTTYYEGNGTGQYTVTGVECDGVPATAVTCPATATTVNAVTCSVTTDTYYTDADVDAPVVSNCDAIASRSYDLSTLGGINTLANWNAGNPATFTTPGAKTAKLTSVTCGTNPVTLANISCTGTITVKQSPTDQGLIAATCQAAKGTGGAAGKEWEDICPNTLWNEVKWTGFQGGFNNGAPVTKGCYYFSSYVDNTIVNMNYDGCQNNGNYCYMINGTKYTGQITGNTIKALTPIDNGYYLYIPPAVGWGTGIEDKFVAAASMPYCADPVTKLICTGMPAGNKTAADSENPFNFSCHSPTGAAPSSVVMTPDWSTIQAGITYAVSADAICDATAVHADCGSLQILAAGVKMDTLSFGNAVDQKPVVGGKSYILKYTGNNAGGFGCLTGEANGLTPEVGTFDGTQKIIAANAWNQGSPTKFPITGVTGKVIDIDAGVPSGLTCGSVW
jgi:hypothetical protein